MTLDELKARFPLGCQVQVTQEAKDKGFHKGERGKVEGYSHKLDLGGRPFLVLRIFIYDLNRRRWCQPSLWEPLPEDDQ
jgi:hypothetical protein